MTCSRPQGPALDLAGLRAEVGADRDLRDLMWGDFDGARPYFGIYGKLGEWKGIFALLEALAAPQARRNGRRTRRARARAAGGGERRSVRGRARSGSQDRILQLPFLPHWRVPEFLRGCLAVCCLEQGFPITIPHADHPARGAARGDLSRRLDRGVAQAAGPWPAD